MTTSLLPVTLLTGFLGSGKTTLLNHLLRQVPLTAVVMNEFGDIALDHQLLQESRGPLALLSGGCVCCQVVGALAPTLKNLAMGRADGSLPPFERVIIETTGIADPAPILATLLHDRWIAARYRLDGVVTCIDALLGKAQLDAHEEALRQVAVADRLLLTKTDLAEAADIAALHLRLDEINPGAPRMVSVQGEMAATEILDLGLFSTPRPDVDRWLAHPRYRPARPAGLIDRRPTHTGRIRSFSLRFDAPLAWDGLSAALEMLTAFRAQQLLRMKALVNLRGRDRPVVLHAVQHVVYPPAELDAWPDADHSSRFVFITDGLDEAFIAKLLQDFTQAIGQAAASSDPDAMS